MFGRQENAWEKSEKRTELAESGPDRIGSPRERLAVGGKSPQPVLRRSYGEIIRQR
jgi:hypothetical protein